MSLTAFFKENVKNPFEEVEFVVSERFQEEGKPIPWKLRAMSPDKGLAGTDKALVVSVDGKSDFKISAYYKSVVIASVVYPNLYDKELQDSYGVLSPEALLDAMLSSKEFNQLLKKCQEINGLDKSFEDKKAQVKNS